MSCSGASAARHDGKVHQSLYCAKLANLKIGWLPSFRNSPACHGLKYRPLQFLESTSCHKLKPTRGTSPILSESWTM